MSSKILHGGKLLGVEVPIIDKTYHVSWAKTGCVSPKTKKKIKTKLKDLRHTRSVKPPSPKH